MLFVSLTENENGTRPNLRSSVSEGLELPPGWAAVPEELEEEAFSYLPYLELTLEEGAVTAVAPGARPAAEEQTEHAAQAGGETQE